MIPTIEQIVEDVKAGTITVAQAINWLHQHAEGAANDLRDHFAGLAMQGFIASGALNAAMADLGSTAAARETLTEASYQIADAMLKARES